VILRIGRSRLQVELGAAEELGDRVLLAAAIAARIRRYVAISLGMSTIVPLRPDGSCRPLTGPAYSTAVENTDFVALGHAGSDAYAGLETFPNPGVRSLELTSDELTAVCPITGQPDYYTVTIAFQPVAHCLESKSLKIYLSRFRDVGAFCEALAVQIRDDVASILELPAEAVTVTLRQKARGGITIVAVA